jgi:hypothetical protein
VIGPFPVPVVIGLAVLAVVGGVVVMVLWGPLCAWGRAPIVPRRAHLLVLALALTFPACLAMIVSLAGRVKLDAEIRDRLTDNADALKREQLTRAEVAGIAQAMVRLAQPSTKEQLRKINMALATCASHNSCRVAFVQTVNRIIRSPAGRSFTVAPPAVPATPPPPAPIAPSAPGTKTVIVKSSPAKDGRDGKDGKNGVVDSKVLDTIDNRLHDVETIVGQLGSAVAGLDQRLGRLLGRLCTALRICL